MSSNQQSIDTLEVQDLCCIRDDRVLFEQLNFELHAGQVLLLEGKNGCGKTSLLRLICGFREPDAGEIFWSGEPLANSEFFAHMAYVGHMDGVKKELTVTENLRMSLALGRTGKQTIDQALQQVQLQGYDDVLAQSLSAGQRRRLALARLLITDSVLWVLDEPFTSLDKHGIAIIEQLMSKHIQQDGMIILTSHHQLNWHTSKIMHINLSK